jgi:hypothetical protein
MLDLHKAWATKKGSAQLKGALGLLSAQEGRI